MCTRNETAALGIGAQRGSKRQTEDPAAQAHADVALPYGQPRPLSLFLLTIAGSGDRKTTADRRRPTGSGSRTPSTDHDRSRPGGHAGQSGDRGHGGVRQGMAVVTKALPQNVQSIVGEIRGGRRF